MLTQLSSLASSPESPRPVSPSKILNPLVGGTRVMPLD